MYRILHQFLCRFTAHISFTLKTSSIGLTLNGTRRVYLFLAFLGKRTIFFRISSGQMRPLKTTADPCFLIFYNCNLLSWSVDKCNTWCMPWTSTMANLAVQCLTWRSQGSRALWSYRCLFPCHIGCPMGDWTFSPFFCGWWGSIWGDNSMAVLIFSCISAKGKSIRKIFGRGFHPTSTAPALLFMLLFVLHNPQGHK